MVFAADFGSVSGDGHSFRYCTVGEFSHDCDWVSVRAVLEKCDEKRRGLGSEDPMRETAVESHSFRKVREKDGAGRSGMAARHSGKRRIESEVHLGES